jgi:hypothetical protein
MALFRSKEAPTDVPSTAFSDFIRNAPSAEKKRIYSKVLRRASESQNEVIARVKKIQTER